MKKALAQLKWHTEQRKIKDLTPYEFNPRKLTDEKRDKLIASIAKFNLAEIPIINKDNVIIAGHQRIKVLLYLDRGEEIIDVRVPNRQLTKFEYKEYNITSNISNGYWDVDVLDAAFSDIDLDALGLDVDNIELPNIDFPEDLISKEDIYEIPVLDEITTNIVKGDIIEFKGSNGEYHRLMCGDATDNKDVTKLMGGGVS